MSLTQRLPTVPPVYTYPHALIRFLVRMPVIQSPASFQALQTLVEIDRMVPGARAMLMPVGGRWAKRLKKLLEAAGKVNGADARRDLTARGAEFVVDVPANGYALAADWLARLGIEIVDEWWHQPWPTSGFWDEIIERWPILDDLLGSATWADDPDIKRAAVAAGYWLVDQLVQLGELKSHIKLAHWPEARPTVDVVRPHQAFGAIWSASRPHPWFQWPPGRGKTLGGLIAALVYPGPILMLGPAKSRKAWRDQTPLFTHLDAHMFTPRSLRRAGDEDLVGYLDRMADTGRRPFVTAGTESLPDYWCEIEDSGLAPSVIIWDEAHELGDSRRVSAIPEPDGSYSFEAKLTKGGDRAKRAVAVMAASRQRSIVARISLTATSIDDGKPRRVYAPLDLTDPWCMGARWDFSHAYCGVTYNRGGHPDDGGRSRMDELKARTRFIIYEATYAETSEGMPPVTLEVTWLPVEDQDEVTGYVQEMSVLTARQEIPTADWDELVDDIEAGRAAKGVPKAIGKLLDDDFEARSPVGMLQELRIAEACSRKRSYVVNRAVEVMRAGGKVVIFTTRRRQVEVWAQKLEQAVANQMKGDLAASWTAPPLLLWGHGGTPEHERWDMLDRFTKHDGPACFSTTAQAMGTSLDGMQCTDRMIVATMPAKIGLFQQVRGRADRYEGVGTVIEIVLGRKTYDEDRTRKIGAKIDGVQALLRADDLDGLALQLLGLPSVADAAQRIEDMLMQNMNP